MSWLDDYRYDAWKTSPPEDEEPESRFKCSKCGEEFYPDDEVYELDDECLCVNCATDWLSDHKRYASYEECFYD